MAKKRICIILSAIVCFCMGAVALMHITTGTVDASAAVAGFSSTDFKMLDKGSVRKNAEQNGIRFATFIGDNAAQADAEYWDSYEMGTLFIPKKAMAEGQELTIDGTYSGVKPITAVFDGNVNNLTTDNTYTGGKLFNAVLELTDFTANATALNGSIVARTYVKNKSTNQVAYLDAVERAPAYVAAKALDAGEEDTNGVLTTYVSKLTVKGIFTSKNLVNNENLPLEWTTNVDGLGLNYSTDLGEIIGNQYIPTQDKGIATITATVAGGKIKKTFKVAIFNSSVKLNRQYYAEKDANEIEITDGVTVHRNSTTEMVDFDVMKLGSIIYNGKTLLEGYDYVKGTNSVSIEKAVLTSTTALNNSLVFKCSNAGDISINVKLSYENQELLPTSVLNNSGKEFSHYAYYSVRDPEITVDDDGNIGGSLTTSDSGINFYSQKYIAEYYDTGLKYALGQSAATIGGLTSNPTLDTATDLKKTLDTAHALGYDNSVIITDGVLIDMDRLCLTNNFKETSMQDIANKTEGKFPTFIDSTPGDHQYASEAKLDEYVEKCLARYMDHPAFGGIMLRDEPSIIYMPLVAEIYKSAQRVFAKHNMPEKKIIVNLLPLYTTQTFSYVTGSDTDKVDSYREYLTTWLELSGDKQLQMDIYSLYTFGIYRMHMVNLQIAAEVAKENGAKIAVINSAWQRMKDANTADERFHTYQDMNWMANIAMSYGSSNTGYYMYHACNDTTIQIVSNGSSMITREGKKTVIYDYAREINKKAQILAPVILDYDYVKGGFVNNFSGSDAGVEYYVKMANYASSSSYVNNGYTKLTNVKANDSKYSWLVNELYNDSNNGYMYAVMNAIDSLNTTSTYDDPKSVTLTFTSEYTHAWVFRNGKFSVVELESGNKLTLSNMIGGDACYVVPFNVADAQVNDTDYVVKPTWGNSAWG